MPHALPLISLTFDDALPEHLDHALPVLNDAGLCGTFYTHLSAPMLAARHEEWRQAAGQGHELGNHTVFHPATESKSWVRAGNAIENYTLDRIQLDLEIANQWLRALDGQTHRTFAYPCSNPVLGRYGWVNRLLHRAGMKNTRWPGIVERLGLDWGGTRASYKPLLSRLFVAARGGGLLLQHTPPPIDRFERYCLFSAAVEQHSFHEMRDFIERGVEAESWSILQFHGVGGGHHMDCRLTAFRDLVHWIADMHREKVVTVRIGAERVWRNASLLSEVDLHA